MSIWDNIKAGIGGVRSGFFPTDPNIDPQTAQALQRQAMLRMAAGLASGRSLGEGFGQGYQDASNFYNHAAQVAYQNTARKQEIEDRRQRDELDYQRSLDQQDREIISVTDPTDGSTKLMRAGEALSKGMMPANRASTAEAPAILQEMDIWKQDRAARGLPPGTYVEFLKERAAAIGGGGPQESFSPFTQADGTVVMVGNRGGQRPTGLQGKVTPPQSSILRPVPASAASGIISNRNEIKKLDAAIAAVEANPDAFGVKNYLPDAVVQRVDNKGVDARAKVADIGSMVVHDRSGAAVSAAEFPRLRPFIPAATDDPETVKTKLQNLRNNIAMMTEEAESIYSEAAGYKPLGQPGAVGPQQIQTDEEYDTLPSGAEFIDPEGKKRRKP